jgi:hypothetical protein
MHARLDQADLRDGVALIMAALREDTETMAHLLRGITTVTQGRNLAIFCILYAAQQSRELERTLPGLDLEAVLRDMALQLAGT